MKFTKRSGLDQELVDEYFFRNERKKDDEKWIKENRLAVIKEMNEAGKDKEDFGDLRVSVNIPNDSKFDIEKVLEYAEKWGFKDKIVKPVLDESKLMEMIESEEIDLAGLQEYAWIESTGSPRVTIKKLDRDED